MKRMLKMLLAVALVLCNGGCASNSGEQLFTYIATVDDLNKILEDPAGNYTLKNDIIFEDGVHFKPLCSLENPFSGILDGNGYCIRNLNIETKEMNVENETVYAGLFGCVSGATIKNLGVSGGTIEISSWRDNVFAGAFAGFSMARSVDGVAVLTDIRNCYSAITIESTGESNGVITDSIMGVGGFLGTGCANFTNCYSKSKIFTYQSDVEQVLGGFVGQPRTFEGYTMKIKSCYSAGAVVGRRVQGGYAGAFVGNSNTLQFVDIAKSYYLTPHENYVGFRFAVSGTTDDKYSGAIGVSYENFEKKESFPMFDFQNSWSISKGINGGQPYLKSQKTQELY